jgi:hypothetical protein
MDRRQLIRGAAALAAYSALPSDVEAASRKLAVVLAGGWSPYPGASLDCDFVRRKYFWAGSPHAESDFATFTSPVFGTPGAADAGLNPSSSTNITLSFAATGLAFPFTLAAIFYPTSSPGGGRSLCCIDGGDSTTDAAQINQSNSTNVATLVIVASANTVNVTGTAAIVPNGQRAAMAASFQTNNTVSSVNGGVNGLSTDSSCAMPTVTTIRFARRSGAGAQPLAAVRRIIAVAGAMTQAQLDALTLALLAVK